MIARDALDRREQDVAERIFELREARGWSQTELAKRAGIGRGTMNMVEGGRTAPRLITLRRLARALGVPVRELLPPEPETHEGATEAKGGGVK